LTQRGFDLAPRRSVLTMRRARAARSGHYALMAEKLSTGMSRVVAAGNLVAALAICTVSGVVWAVASVVGGAAADGYPPDYYDAGSRFAFSVAVMGLIVICLAASLVAYALARCADWSIWRSLGMAQLGAAVFAVPVFALFA
jgi:hypothetical protein